MRASPGSRGGRDLGVAFQTHLSWEALGEARPGQSSLSAGALRYRTWAQSWSSAALMNSGSKVSRGRERRGTRDSREHQLSDRLTGPAATCLLVPADTLNRAVSFYKGRRQARGEVPCSADCSLKGKQGGNSLEVQPLGLHFHCRGQPVVEEQRPCMPRGPAKKRKELERDYMDLMY